MKKRMSIVTALIMVFALLLTACGEPAVNTDTSDNPASSAATTPVSTAVTTEEKEETPDLPSPEDLGFDGQELTILVWKIAARTGVTDNDDFYDENDVHMEGEAVYDAALERQRTIEEKYGVTIKTEVTSDNVHTKYLNSYKSGDAKWDIIAPMINHVPSLIIEQTLLEIGNLEYLDPTKTYWDQDLLSSLAVDGKNFVLTGEISTMDEELNICVAYNQTVGEEVGIDPYPYIENDKWTIDVLSELAKVATKDLDGNGKMDKTDRFGLADNHSSAITFIQAAGERYATLNSNGVPEITVNAPRAIQVIEKINALYNDPTIAATITSGPTKIYASWAELNQSMVDGLICFRPANIYNLKQYIQMEDVFTVLPMPKLEEDQEKYYHVVLTNGCAGYCVPANTDRTEFISVMLEELAYYGRKLIKPAYYESYVNARLTNDETTSKMFDIIFATKMYDIGYMFNWGGMQAAVAKSIETGNTASNLDGIMNAAKTALQETYDSIHEAIN
ncbi:MAG: hypothetical protein E7665_02305 [Ruminococcaceae bacterium]|nr:hypothetical protein [Oscillospiraceae bacterium]